MDLDKLIKLLSEEKNNANKVDILGNIVTLLHEDGNNQVEIYRYLKDWFICYLESLLLKSYRYDVIKNNIVNEKINLLEGMQKLAYVKFIVRNLKKIILCIVARCTSHALVILC